MPYSKQPNNLFLEKIAEILASKTSETKNVSLFDGKAGVVLFFYKYSAYLNNQKFKKIADLMIDDICEEISSVSELGFTEGLSGIGWCFAYLLQNNFLDEDTDETLLEIDEIIIKKQSHHYVIHENSGDLFGSGL